MKASYFCATNLLVTEEKISIYYQGTFCNFEKESLSEDKTLIKYI